GLIDADDSSFEQAAARELKEETGYDVVRVDDVLRATYTSPGMTNETVAFVYMTVDDAQTDVHQHLEDSEDITVRWVD
ncbi:NUDIX hydrolase, partial [Streptococcus agalactiae]|nr:NUDIX hydrolase [Streptococcus agalactiae]